MKWMIVSRLFCPDFFMFRLVGRQTPADDNKADDMYNGCDDPGNGVGDIQHFQGMIMLKYSVDPDNTKAAGSDQGYNHGKDSIAKTTDHTDKDIHDTAGKINGTDDFHSFKTIGYDVRIWSVQTEQFPAKQVDQVAQSQTNHRYDDKAGNENLIDSSIFATAIILAGKAKCCLIDAVHGSIYKGLNAGAGGIA